MRKGLILILSVAAMVFVSGPAKAVLLSDLVNNLGTIEIGDKLFSDFYGVGFDWEDLDVAAIGTGTPSDPWGLSFNRQGYPGAFTAADGAVFEGVLSYKVTVTDPAFAIAGIKQLGSWWAEPQPRGAFGDSQIAESLYDAEVGGNKVAESRLSFNDDPSEPPENLDPPAEVDDQLVVSPPLGEAWVKTEIRIRSEPDSKFHLTAVYQRFLQEASVPDQQSIPDAGSSALLLLIAFPTLAFLRRRSLRQALCE